uniref:Nas2 N-terminal domain-containing protein n=1 Tax=Plectus sambesii TaxID=2011161 RepID=A0A914VDZ1_9BILA
MATKEEVKKLMDDRDELDKQLADHFAILKVNNVDMETPLVDAEGFPRADIDVYAVREARNKVICKLSFPNPLTDMFEMSKQF